ncbi:MAG TPA: flavodoxin family protein [Bacillota bacterium]|nr:flavodoxin family protein [Bacillota bacterium]
MKVLAVSGGSKDGSNDSMAKEALMGAKEQGAEVEFIRLLDLDLKPCTGCIACVNSLMTGGSGKCIIKDDFNWLDEKVLDVDALLFAVPIFEKGAPAVFKLIQDRLCGPSHDTGINIVAGKIAEEAGRSGPDPRKLKRKAVSYISIGASNWTSRAAADMALTAMTSMWKVVDNTVFSWSKSIIMEDEKVAECHRIGADLAKAAADIENAQYLGETGICSNCYSRNFLIHKDGSAECEVCGIKGKLSFENGTSRFDFPEGELEHAHTLLPGKFKHMDDIRRVETKLVENKKTDEFKARVKKYKEFIQASRP